MKWFGKKRTYLDFAAGVLGNPSSPHEEGRRAQEELEEARTRVARELQVKADDIIFTSGATEANAIAILGMWGFTKSPHALYLPSAHASVVENMKMLEERGVIVEPLPIADGRVDTEALKQMLRPETVLVSMDAVCGETGTVWNTREVATVIRKYGFTKPVFLHVDASQAVLTENVSRAHFDADLLTLDGAKLGVRGVGCLVAHRTIPLAPLYGGGGQERGLCSGTENVEAIVEFADALVRARREREGFKARALRAREGLIASLKTIPNLAINSGVETVPHILNISLIGRDTDYLVTLLDHAGFAVSTRSACESASTTGSRAVLALTGDAERARSTLRISWGPSTTRADLARFARALAESVRFLDAAKGVIMEP